jgi:methanogenic corrinoid protein MtbC1
MKPLLSPRDLADAIGVSESSVKRWVDGGVVLATKTAGGHRRIPVSEAVRFIRESQAALVKPEAMGLNDLESLLDLDTERGDDGTLLYDYLREGKAESARGLLLSLYLNGRSVAQIVDGTLLPAMELLGEIWKSDECGIFWEHRATEIAISAISRLRMLIPPRDESAPAAVGAAPPGDPYILPTLCAAAVLESQGLNAVNLGPDTPIASLQLATEALRAQLVWLSVSVVPNSVLLQQELLALAAAMRKPGVPIIIGGSQAHLLALPDSALSHVGSSMSELEAMVKGLRVGTTAQQSS